MFCRTFVVPHLEKEKDNGEDEGELEGPLQVGLGVPQPDEGDLGCKILIQCTGTALEKMYVSLTWQRVAANVPMYTV